MIFFSALAILTLSTMAFAQGGGIQANAETVAAYKAIGAGLGFGIAAGLGALGFVANRARQGRYGPRAHLGVEMSGLYWHLVDLVWIFLFPLLYLI